MTERYQALFTMVEQAIRGHCADEIFWAAVEQQLLQLDKDILSLRFILPQTFTLEDEIVRMIGLEGVAN